MAVQFRAASDRDSSFEPQIVRERQRRFEGSTARSWRSIAVRCQPRDIVAHLREIYGVNLGRDLISRVTDEVMDDT